MTETRLAARLQDPVYLEQHLAAVAAVRELEAIAWYDSVFLRHLEAARRYLAIVRPDALQRFVDGFAALQPAAGFAPIEIADLLSAARHAEIRTQAVSIPPELIERHEAQAFGRLVVHNHAPFVRLQQELAQQLSELVGVPLTPGYSFLALYGSAGRCAPHMDQPISMYTLDYCIDQDAEWPIHFSPVVDWPTVEGLRHAGGHDQRHDPNLSFTAYTLRPNSALMFCGSSQWHYREAMEQGSFCNLLFLHYYPAGCENLVQPSGWAAHFDLPELDALVDLLVAADRTAA